MRRVGEGGGVGMILKRWEWWRGGGRGRGRMPCVACVDKGLDCPPMTHSFFSHLNDFFNCIFLQA